MARLDRIGRQLAGVEYLKRLVKNSAIERIIERTVFPIEKELIIMNKIINFKVYTVHAFLRYTNDDDPGTYSVPIHYVGNLSDGDRVYDVGADHGFYTLISAIGVGEDGEVVAFEPDTKSYGALEENTANNDVPANIATENIAVADTAGERFFERNRLTDQQPATKVPAKPLDEVEYPPPDMIKIDVEGAEWLILQGAEETIRTHRPKLQIEIHAREKVRQIGGSWEKIYDLLLENGYSILRDSITHDGLTDVHNPPSEYTGQHHIHVI